MLLLSLLTIPSDIFDGLFKNKSTTTIELEQSFPTTAPGTMNQVLPNYVTNSLYNDACLYTRMI